MNVSDSDMSSEVKWSEPKNHLGVENLTRRATRLRVLDLSDSSLITDKSVSFVLRHCQQLEHVAFSRCYNIAPITYA